MFQKYNIKFRTEKGEKHRWQYLSFKNTILSLERFFKIDGGERWKSFKNTILSLELFELLSS